MPDTTSKDDELLQFIKSKYEYWFMIEVKTGHWVVDENAMIRDLVPYIKQYSIQERKDELFKTYTQVIGDEKAPHSRYSRVTKIFTEYLKKRNAELAALKDKK